LEISVVRKRLVHAIERARARAKARRQVTSEAERAYEIFLEQTAVPVTRMVANALKAEGLSFTVFTPSGGLRLASDRERDDYIELALDLSADRPQVIGRISHVRGSRTLAEERALRPGAGPGELTEDDVLTFLVDSLEPWLDR
jgi:hypothetical protein